MTCALRSVESLFIPNDFLTESVSPSADSSEVSCLASDGSDQRCFHCSVLLLATERPGTTWTPYDGLESTPELTSTEGQASSPWDGPNETTSPMPTSRLPPTKRFDDARRQTPTGNGWLPLAGSAARSPQLLTS